MKKALCAALATVLTLSLLSACGGTQEENNVDLAAFAQTLTENHAFTDGLALLNLEEESGRQAVETYLPGLLELDLEQRVVYMSLARPGMDYGELSIVQAKNPRDAEKVKDIFQARADYMAQGGAAYPDPARQWMDNARVATSGSYVLMVCAGGCDAIVDEFNALFE